MDSRAESCSKAINRKDKQAHEHQEHKEDSFFVRVINAAANDTGDGGGGDNDKWLYVHFETETQTYIVKRGANDAAIFHAEQAARLVEKAGIEQDACEIVSVEQVCGKRRANIVGIR